MTRYWRSIVIVFGILVVGAVLALLVGNIIGEDGASSDATSNATLECSSNIDVIPKVPDEFNVIQGVAAINSSHQHQLGRRGTDDSPQSSLLFAKMALLVRPQQKFHVTLGEDDLELARIGWSAVTARSPVQHLSVGPCDGDPDTWLVFAGGVWVADRGCVELVFGTSNGSATAMLSIGQRCPSAA